MLDNAYMHASAILCLCINLYQVMRFMTIYINGVSNDFSMNLGYFTSNSGNLAEVAINCLNNFCGLHQLHHSA